MAFGTRDSPPEAGVICLAFQSLFFWNGLWDICQGLLRRSGSTFQSLFFWNGLWDVGQALLGAAELVFQSLFFWNGLWDSPPRRRLTISIAGFNPCFSGMAFGTGVDLLADAILR